MDLESQRQEVECTACEGEGIIWNNADPTSGQSCQCDECHGNGWRPETDEEANDRAADAFSDMCESEPPLSFAERCEMDAKRVKRCTIPHFRQSQTKAAFPITGNLAVLRDGVLGFTATAPQGEI